MRPEHTAPPEIFYNVDEAQKYSRNTRIMEIQATMSERAIEMLNLKEDEPSYILDVGCGSGLSGECLDEQVIPGKKGDTRQLPNWSKMAMTEL